MTLILEILQEKAADAVHSIANSVNKQVGASENMEQMLHVYEELGGEKVSSPFT